ncbi:MAG: sigma-54 dependent transcriptional regulator [Rikenellaceae bacterium]
MAKILVADDHRAIRNAIKELLEMEQHTVEVAEDGAVALEKIKTGEFDLLITDIMMPNLQGNKLISKVRELGFDLSIIVISGHGTINLAVECVKNGAIDFIEKPVDMNTLLTMVREGLSSPKEAHSSGGGSTVARSRRSSSRGKCLIIGRSKGIEQVKDIIKKVAPTDSRVLITGHNGTGKELVARSIHQQSHRSSAPFIEVNCAAIPSELIESELFGHEKGSFTSANKQHKGKFEQAQGGTIFLDEIGDMSLSAQAKVLRALQEHKITRVGADRDIRIDARVICATNKNLKQEISRGTFREDLYHRVGVICIEVPSLADRADDIPLLVDHFLEIVCREQGEAKREISDQAIAALQALPWSGNIRELCNMVERLVILGGSVISEQDVISNS